MMGSKKLFKSEEECLELRRAEKELEVAKANLEEEVTKRLIAL